MTHGVFPELERKINVMEAYRNGATIQEIRYGSRFGWHDCNGDPLWNWSEYDYRVAPKPTHKPFNDKYEFAQALHKNSSMPYVLFDGDYRIVSQIYDKGITIAFIDYTYEELVEKNVKFLNGAVCGIPV